MTTKSEETARVAQSQLVTAEQAAADSQLEVARRAMNHGGTPVVDCRDCVHYKAAPSPGRVGLCYYLAPAMGLRKTQRQCPAFRDAAAPRHLDGSLRGDGCACEECCLLEGGGHA